MLIERTPRLHFYESNQGRNLIVCRLCPHCPYLLAIDRRLFVKNIVINVYNPDKYKATIRVVFQRYVDIVIHYNA
uniref:Radical SAM protein n=1 Tax=Ascaris lumbricoides TaxID=6252 RepID=A0A0M3HY76_ASCLU